MPTPPVDWTNGTEPEDEPARARVLVVEDDSALRELMADVLTLEGCTVTEAKDAADMQRAVHLAGLKAFPDDAFDLIVTDVRMPGDDGIDALVRLRKTGCRIPAIVVTAFPADAMRGEMRPLNALLLPKPFNLEDFRSVADLVLRTQPKGTRGAAWPA